MGHGMGRVKHIHFVGIGGAGMAPIAEILREEGYCISGSDVAENALTQRLTGLGVSVVIGHTSANIAGADVLVYSSAVMPDNVEMEAARKAGIPQLQRAQMLAELMRFREGIAIAGTHGKTTTTSLVASLLNHADLSPTYVIGGKLNSSGAHAAIGKGRHIVVEADESDASFLYLKPTMAIVTNIDADHMSTYDNDFERLKNTFIDFLHHLPFYGPAVLCADDAVVTEVAPKIQRPQVLYGFSDSADYQAIDFEQQGMQSMFTVNDTMRNERYRVCLNMPGQYNVQNALAAMAMARECGASPESMIECLQNFTGVGRRLQCHGQLAVGAGKQVLLYDDYGHHPRELAVTVEALKNAYPHRRVVVIFQPHRYSRTQALFDDFVAVLAQVEHCILMPIFPASEQPIDGVSSHALATAVGNGTVTLASCEVETLAAYLQDQCHDDDILLMAGAGSIGACAVQLSKQCAPVEV